MMMMVLQLLRIWQVMDESIREGCQSKETHLPGVLKLKRRAPALYQRLLKGVYPSLELPRVGMDQLGLGSVPDEPQGPSALSHHTDVTTSQRPRTPSPPAPTVRPKVQGRFDHPLAPVPPKRTSFQEMDFLSTYAIAVNEVNASGGRVLTSPTNGAAGVIPSVLKFHLSFTTDDPWRDIQTFLFTASAIGMLYRRGATISAAEGGCQAEVGVACSMAAAGFAAVMGGTPRVIAQAAEVGMEHSLGQICDPIAGLVQVPCIERVAVGAVKAVTAAQLALSGDGDHLVSLDDVIEVMRQTGKDMHVRYRETSLGGLARVVRLPVAVPEC